MSFCNCHKLDACKTIYEANAGWIIILQYGYILIKFCPFCGHELEATDI